MARREWSGARTLFFMGHSDLIAADAGPGGEAWAEALELGMNELHICLAAQERLDRLQLKDRIVRRVGPLLNLIGPEEMAQPPARRCVG